MYHQQKNLTIYNSKKIKYKRPECWELLPNRNQDPLFIPLDLAISKTNNLMTKKAVAGLYNANPSDFPGGTWLLTMVTNRICLQMGNNRETFGRHLHTNLELASLPRNVLSISPGWLWHVLTQVLEKQILNLDWNVTYLFGEIPVKDKWEIEILQKSSSFPL